MEEIIIELLKNWGLYELLVPYKDEIVTGIKGALTSGLPFLGKKFYDEYQKKQSLARFDFCETPERLAHLKYYVPTRYQQIPPSKHESGEINKQFKGVTPVPLIPYLLKEGFDHQINSDRFSLILADSGMGKTTFMINLYMSYISQWAWWKRPYHIKLMAAREFDEKFKKIKEEEHEKTIVLIDALDEDQKAVENFEERVDYMVEKTKDCVEVIFTCRTQFYSKFDSEIYNLKLYRKTGGGKAYTMPILYLSPFSEKDVALFLRKKFGYFPTEKKNKAQEIARNNRLLMARPLLLSYVEDLVESTKSFEFSFEVYEVMISKWIGREEFRKDQPDQENFRKELRSSSEMLAWKMFQEKKMQFSNVEIETFAADTNKVLQAFEFKGRSLLTRNTDGKQELWKFAHKSIMEYFIALKAFESGTYEDEDFAGMDQALLFLKEMYWTKKKSTWDKIPKAQQQEVLKAVPLRFLRLDISAKALLSISQEYAAGKKIIGELVWLDEDTYAEMILVKGGKFQMGYDSKRDGEYADYLERSKPLHEVELDDFWIGKTQVTQKQWQAIMGNNPSKFKGDNLPVEQVSWDDIKEYLKKLNEKMTASGGRGGFSLPSEAQWEYVARGGQQSKGYKYAGSNNLDEVAWYSSNSGNKTHEVGTKNANELGIYDMSGNVWEWCADGYDKDFYASAEASLKNPINNRAKNAVVLRGGSWYGGNDNCRLAYRVNLIPTYGSDNSGFRLCVGL